MQQPHVLAVGAPRLLCLQRVVGPPVRHARVQLLPVHIAGEGPRLAHQPVDHVAVLDVVLALTVQARHRLHARPGVPDLDRLGVDPRLDALTDQSRRHRVAVLLHLDRAPLADAHPLPLPRRQRLARQRPQPGPLLGQRRLAWLVAPRHQRAHELGVRLPAREVPAAPQQQRLLQRLLEAPVALLAIAVLVAARRVRRLGAQPVMRQQRPVLRRILFRAALVVHRQRHPIRAVPRRRPTQLGQRRLQTRAEAGEALREAQADVLPVRVRQHEVVQQVRKRLALDGHRQPAHAREVRRAQPPRLMHLGEEHFLGRPVLRAPLPHAPLQRPPRPLPVLAGVLLLQPLQQRLGLQPRLALQQLLQARPDRREGIRPGPPGAGHRRAVGAGAILARGLAIHACLHRRVAQRCSSLQLVP